MSIRQIVADTVAIILMLGSLPVAYVGGSNAYEQYNLDGYFSLDVVACLLLWASSFTLIFSGIFVANCFGDNHSK